MVFSADGSMLASVGDEGAVKVWDPTTGDQISAFDSTGEPYWASFSADGSLLITIWAGSGRTRLTDVATGELVDEYLIEDVEVASISPDGTKIAVGLAAPPFAVVVDAQSGETIVPLEGHANLTTWVAWSPDGTRIATASQDSTARIWDAETGAVEAVAVGHKSVVNVVDWSPDGTRIATGGNDGTARVWDLGDDVATEVLRLSARDLSNGVAAVSFSPDGDRLLTSDLSVTAAKVFDVSRTGGGEVATVVAPRGIMESGVHSRWDGSVRQR